MANHSRLDEVEAQAALYAIGALPEGEARQFRQRLDAGCPLCCSEARECEEAVSALSFTAEEVAPPPELRERLLERIAGGRKRARFTPMGVGRLVRPGDSDWESSPVPGVTIRRLHEKSTMLVRMVPKTVLPEHMHHAAEQCLVLEGSVTGSGLTAYAGDFTFMPAGSTHEPLYTETGCLLLIAYT